MSVPRSAGRLGVIAALVALVVIASPSSAAVPSIDGPGSALRAAGRLTPPTTTPPPPVTPPPSLSAEVRGVLEATNAERVAHGIDPFVFDSLLSQAARIHADDQFEQPCIGGLSHIGTDGSLPWDRIDRTGFEWSTAAENIACGQRSAQDVVTAWMNSPGHRANILSPDLTHIGISFSRNAEGRTYWVQVFAAPL